MKVLLVTSPAPERSPFGTSEKRPPLGLGYLISVLREAEHEVLFLDLYLQPDDFWERGYLGENGIEMVGVYANTICFNETLRVLEGVEAARRHGEWSGKIVVGGPHTTVAAQTIPSFVDHVVQGEGELAIMDVLEGEASGRIIRRCRVSELDKLPAPAWDVFAELPYDYSCPWFGARPVFTLNTSRGCPFTCSFCSVESIWGRTYTTHSPQWIVDQIKHLIDNYGARGIYFREDNFAVQRKRVKAFCQLLQEQQLEIEWACETRADHLDRDLIQTMWDAGCRAYYVGVEHASQRILDRLDKHIKLDKVREMFRICKDVGIATYASLITGVPDETFDDVRQLMKFVNVDLKPDHFYISVFVGIPGSLLYRETLESGEYEYIDERGLVYVKGHNTRMKIFNGDDPNRLIDVEDHRVPFVQEVNKLKDTILERMARFVARWRQQDKLLGIYGAGLQTQRLFDQIDFCGNRIIGFYDRCAGEKIDDFRVYPVYLPERLEQEPPEVLLISLTKALYPVWDALRHLECRGVEIVPLYLPDEPWVV